MVGSVLPLPRSVMTMPALPERRPDENLQDWMTRALVDRIQEGVYPAQSPFPSGAQLREEFGVSQMVVRVARERLKERGLLVERRGVGLYVA